MVKGIYSFENNSRKFREGRWPDTPRWPEACFATGRSGIVAARRGGGFWRESHFRLVTSAATRPATNLECQNKLSTTDPVGTSSNQPHSSPEQQWSARLISCAEQTQTSASTSPAL